MYNMYNMLKLNLLYRHYHYKMKITQENPINELKANLHKLNFILLIPCYYLIIIIISLIFVRKQDLVETVYSSDSFGDKYTKCRAGYIASMSVSIVILLIFIIGRACFNYKKSYGSKNSVLDYTYFFSFCIMLLFIVGNFIMTLLLFGKEQCVHTRTLISIGLLLCTTLVIICIILSIVLIYFTLRFLRFIALYTFPSIPKFFDRQIDSFKKWRTQKDESVIIAKNARNQQMKCLDCGQKKSSVILFPCRHLARCSNCDNLKKGKYGKCPSDGCDIITDDVCMISINS